MSTPQGQPTPTQRTASVAVKHDFDMRLGKVLIYTIAASGFSIVAHRGGVACRGQMPLMAENGVREFMKLFERAIVHHHHLKKTWDEGPNQTILSELIVDQRMAPVLIAEA